MSAADEVQAEKGPAVDRAARSFALVLWHASSRPGTWHLKVREFNSLDGEPLLIDVPAQGVELRAHLVAAKVADGTYRVTIEPKPGMEYQASTSAKRRLRAYGPLATIVKVGEGKKAEAAPAVPPADIPRVQAVPSPQGSTTVRAIRDQIETRKAQLELWQLELEERQIRRQLGNVAGVEPQQAKDSPASWLPALVGAAMPLIERVVSALMQSSQRREELLTRLVAARDEVPAVEYLPAPVTAPVDPASGLRSTMETMREMASLVSELGIGGGEPSMVSTVGQLVQHLAPLLAMPAPNRGQAPAANARRTIKPGGGGGSSVEFRTVQWLLSVKKAAEEDLDPETVADGLDAAFGMLPGKTRNLILDTANSLDAVVAGLGSAVPAVVHTQLVAAIAQPPVREWLTQFLDAMRDDGGDEPEDDGEPFHAGTGAATLNGSSPADDNE